MKIRIIDDDNLLIGIILHKWHGVAYRRWERRQTVLYIIPLNLIVRYAYIIYWVLYGWVKHDYWPRRIEQAYRQGYSESSSHFMEFLEDEIQQRAEKLLTSVIGRWQKDEEAQ